MNKKVYLVLHTLSVGGAERHASSIANYLNDNGFNVVILLLDDNTIDYNLSEGVQVIALSDIKCKTKKSIKQSILFKTSELFCKNQYLYLDRFYYYKNTYSNKLEHFFRNQDDINNSVIISFMPTPNISASIAKKNMKYRLILGEFSSPHLAFAPDAPENTLKKKYYPNADGFVFQTEEQKSFYSFLPNVKKVIIPNPLEDIKTQPYNGERRKEIINFCRLVPVKNIPLLVEAFAKLSKEYPDYNLVVYGEGCHKETIEKCISKFGVEDKVFIKPFAKNVLDLVRDSAMFVTSSDREGISNSMLEAMAIGLPTISTDCPAGGARMVIKPYENGIIVPVRDPEAMYKAMKYMIDNPDEAEKMGKDAGGIRNTLEKNKILKQWLSFVNEIGEFDE